jgi:hypothetical protein
MSHREFIDSLGTLWKLWNNARFASARAADGRATLPNESRPSHLATAHSNN